MAVDERASRRRKGEDPPVARTGTPPPQVPDWNWLLQTLMGLQKTVGELSQAVANLTGRLDLASPPVLACLRRSVDRCRNPLFPLGELS